MKDGQVSIMIKNANVFTLHYQKPTFEKKSFLIENGKVKAISKPDVFEEKNSFLEDIQVWDASDMYFIPPFSNGHSHSYTGILKRTVEAVPLDLYMLEAIAYGKNRSTELIYDCTLLHGYELLRNGYQMTVDHFSERPTLTEEGIDAAVQAYRELGLRTVLAPMFSDRNYLDSLPFNKAYPKENDSTSEIDNYESLICRLMRCYEQNKLITISLGVDGVQRCSNELLERTSKMKNEFELGWHSHLLESHTQWTYSKQQGESLLQRIDSYGLLDEKTVFAHAIWTTEEDRKLMSDRGVSIVHCTCSNLHLGSGICPIHLYQSQSVDWHLGTDGFNCGTLNAFELMRQAARVSRLATDNHENWLTAEEVFIRMITPTSLSKKDWVHDFLSENQPASFLAFSYEDLLPEQFFSEVVYYENGENMRDIMMDGAWMKRNGVDQLSSPEISLARRRIQENQIDYQQEINQARSQFSTVNKKITKSWEYVQKNWPEAIPKVRT
ncbi:amidohydrolase family protein [Gracilibacillus sp. YIM 98692]|uniref:amidohydrolase family protein n=1 Tax=Gracilibacillus sp. YIM 98692 TaxID=2663532 RepID=UPI0013D8D633|nr:amidohydrolase family protein [Gracilibacillus sp. YIM 98692]